MVSWIALILGAYLFVDAIHQQLFTRRLSTPVELSEFLVEVEWLPDCSARRMTRTAGIRKPVIQRGTSYPGQMRQATAWPACWNLSRQG